jgi:hypothetical protein
MILEVAGPALAIATRLPDLIVMGTHARKGIQRLLLGSLTERVLRTAHVPVLAVPPAERTAPITYERILCPIEFRSEPAALEYVLSLVLPFMKGEAPRSKKPGARLILLYVVENFSTASAMSVAHLLFVEH